MSPYPEDGQANTSMENLGVKLTFSSAMDSKEATAANADKFAIYDEDGKTSNIDGREYPICKGNVVVAKPGQTRFSFLHMRNSYLWLVPDDGKIINS